MNQVPEPDIIFMSLILNIHSAALQQMGKIVNPMNGELDRNLEGAKQSIDLLESLERKTKGNLSADEEKTLQEILTNLRLNYVDELKKGPAAEAAPEEGESEPAAEAEGESESAAGAGD